MMHLECTLYDQKGAGSKLPEDKIARGKNCTKGQVCTKTFLQEDKFARGDKIAQRQICTKGQFCTIDKFARLSNLHGLGLKKKVRV